MIDFDKLFQDYILKWYKENANSYPNADDLESAAVEQYSKWVNTELAELDGKTPINYFESIQDGKKLVEMFCTYHTNNKDIPDLLLERMGEVKGCEDGLLKILLEDSDNAKLMYAMNLLNELDSNKALDIYVDWVFEAVKDADLLELCCEILAENI